MTYWLYPANTKFYDVIGAMAERETYWPMRTQVSPGDQVLIYLAAPYKQVGFVCDVTATDVSEASVRSHVQRFLKGEQKPESTSNRFMKLRPNLSIPIESDSSLGLPQLKRHGLNGMLMGPRRLDNNPELLDYIIGSLP